MRKRNYPYPFKAWLTISSDPDNTDLKTWKELDDLIFNRLKLPWANSIFLYSHNLNLPDQVSLSSHAVIATQPIDTIHTWGDFVHGGARGFSREDALSGMILLEQYGIRPLVWVDHSRFTGNLLHGNAWGSIPVHRDSSGISYKVHEYTLDLIHQTGVRYIWDGGLTEVIGQDRKPSIWDVNPGQSRLKALLSGIKRELKEVYSRVRKGKRLGTNKFYFTHLFPDGRTLYCFRRYGKWRNADIVGLSKQISKKNIDALVRYGGVMAAYTHLGKKNPELGGASHVPDETLRCLEHVRKRMDDGSLNFSSLSKLLDYLVIRDHMFIQDKVVDFRSDGIRFSPISIQDLKSHQFSLEQVSDPKSIKVLLDGNVLDQAFVQSNGGGICTIMFRE
jgi:hypothetical protein